MHTEQRLIWFRRLGLGGAMLAATVVVLGAWVRLTAAGLGCPDWPGCYGHVYPEAGHEFGRALREMIHRYAATSLGLIITTLAAWALINRREPGQPLAVPIALFAVVCVQGALGALTVTLLLTPLVVTAHLLGGLTTLGLASWLSMAPEGPVSGAPDRSLQRFALAALAVLVLQTALGGWTSANYAALACPDLPTCQGSWWPSMDYRAAFRLSHGLGIDYEGGVLANPARMAIHFTHRAGAIVTALVLLSLAGSAWRRAPSCRLRHAARQLALAVCVQIASGVLMVRWNVPLPLATLHNAGAALLVITVVNLLRALWPAADPTMLRLPDAGSAR
ncbi:MAG: heme A synthase [Steroidobacterales bacterium]